MPKIKKDSICVGGMTNAYNNNEQYDETINLYYINKVKDEYIYMAWH